MQRITKKSDGIITANCEGCKNHGTIECNISKCLYRMMRYLSAYESAGLTPKEIAALCEENRKLKANLAKAIDDLREADRNCLVCKHHDNGIPQECLGVFIGLNCRECEHPCKCGPCENRNNWEWRGVTDDGEAR